MKALLLVALVGCTPTEATTGQDGSSDALPDLVSGCQPACSGFRPYCNGTLHCVGCTSDAHCGAGSYCKVESDTKASCALGCIEDGQCGGGTNKCCGGRCVDTSVDGEHCGSCEQSCAMAHEKGVCLGSQCQTGGMCEAGWGDCDVQKAGCETNLRVDGKHCTKCGMGCAMAHAIPGCADGCYIASCDWGWDDCNAQAGDGCETSVLMSAQNCGACGKKCQGLPNAAASCAAGNCVLGMCNSGYENCDGKPANGCEVDLNSDANHCGKCGQVCSQNAPFCDQGVCKNGCLNGKAPLAACATGKDPQTSAPWVICKADCTMAWISAQKGGGTYHAGQICKDLGYTKVSAFGGNWDDVCGYNQPNTSCQSPGTMTLDGSGNAGMDQYGQVLSVTVMWQCTK